MCTVYRYYMGCCVTKIEIKEEDNMSVASKIATNIIKRAPGGPESTFGELWKDHVGIFKLCFLKYLSTCINSAIPLHRIIYIFRLALLYFSAVLDDPTADWLLARFPRLSQSLIQTT